MTGLFIFSYGNDTRQTANIGRMLAGLWFEKQKLLPGVEVLRENPLEPAEYMTMLHLPQLKLKAKVDVYQKKLTQWSTILVLI